MPIRDDRRRALVATTALIAARPIMAQEAAAHILAADLGAGPLSWLLTALRDALRADELYEDLAGQLTDCLDLPKVGSPCQRQVNDGFSWR